MWRHLILPTVFFAAATFFVLSHRSNMAMAESSFGQLGHEDSRAQPSSVISMGRDDDDGNATLWHIGGGED